MYCPDFHDLSSIPYQIRVDTELAEAWHQANQSRGLESRKAAYDGFPIDGELVVACKLLNPDNRLPVVICSSNVCHRSERRSRQILFGCHQQIRQESRCCFTS